jgi:hypothetical protein
VGIFLVVKQLVKFIILNLPAAYSLQGRPVSGTVALLVTAGCAALLCSLLGWWGVLKEVCLLKDAPHVTFTKPHSVDTRCFNASAVVTSQG